MENATEHCSVNQVLIVTFYFMPDTFTNTKSGKFTDECFILNNKTMY